MAEIAFELKGFADSLAEAINASSMVTKCLQKALDQTGTYLHNVTYGNARRDGKTHEEAMEGATKVSGLTQGTMEQAYGHLAFILHGHGHFEEARQACEVAIGLNPEFWDCHVNLGMLSLMKGDWKRGWEEYQFLWNLPFKASELTTTNHMPWWTGEDLGGKTLLVTRDQGTGDSFMMMRFYAHIKRLFPTCRLIVESHPEMASVLSADPAIDLVVPLTDFRVERTKADYKIPSFGLPRLFPGEFLADEVPYVIPDQRRVERFKPLLPAGFNIGICWAGSPVHPNDYQRSISLREFGELDLPGVNLISLQKGEREDEADPYGVTVHRFSDKLNDFDDTVALASLCDLIITCDTSVVHMAGAMGKKTWMLNPFIPEWRWMEHRSDSPWYPTLTIYRQIERGNYTEVFKRVRRDLEGIVPGPQNSIC